MRLVLVATIVMALPACGGEEPASTTTSASASDSTTTSTESAPSTRVMAATTSTVSHVDVEFVEGDVVGPESVQVELGETVDLWVLSDVDDEIHVHGYDLFYDLEAGVPFHLTFLADVPGIFEVEVHTGHTRLLDIEVIG